MVELKDLQTVSESQKCFQFLKKAIFRGNRLRYVFTYWTTHSKMLVLLLLKFHLLHFEVNGELFSYDNVLLKEANTALSTVSGGFCF